MIQIGKYIEIAIQWLTENFAPFFDAVNSGIGGGIDVFNQALLWIPFYLFIFFLPYWPGLKLEKELQFLLFWDCS